MTLLTSLQTYSLFCFHSSLYDIQAGPHGFTSICVTYASEVADATEGELAFKKHFHSPSDEQKSMPLNVEEKIPAPVLPPQQFLLSLCLTSGCVQEL